MRPPARFGASSSRIHMHPTAQAQLQSQASNGPVNPRPRACTDCACAPRTERALACAARTTTNAHGPAFASDTHAS